MWPIFSALKGVSAQDIKYQSSADNSSILQNVLNTKNTLLGAIVGLAVVLLAFVITNTVLNGVF